MTAWQALLAVWIIAAVMMAFGWHWQKEHANAGIVDVLWACALAVAAVLLAASMRRGASAPRAAVAVMGGIWGLRLAAHLWARVRGKDEDGRYRHLRDLWHGDQRKLFAFFQLQAGLAVLFALPFLAAASNRETSAVWLIAGIVIWTGSVLGESVADRQLARFRADPEHRGRTCRAGLWRCSRHPNYFFEWLHWFAYVALAQGSTLAWLAWAGPIMMFVFLRWISGIPFTEAQALRTRGDDYRRYQRSTPMLFPWFPRPTGRKGSPQ
ncbi:MAG TPA: DUF1295 domain-containing protein [Steroidobacteraceae bacterium]|nr:DUF1295 domain-containing protein [Steroidobacteraceae bacterium]